MDGKPVLATVYRPDILADKASDRFVEFDALARIGPVVLVGFVLS